MLRGGERFPESRHRHAATLELAQHIPDSHSTLRIDYRYYRDSFRVVAHNARFVFYQYLGPHVLVRTHYRFYIQTAAYFFGTSFPQTVIVMDGEQERTRPWLFEPAVLQTSDSDLDAFSANEFGTEFSLLGSTGDALELGYTYYVRTNGLSAHLLSLGYVGRY